MRKIIAIAVLAGTIAVIFLYAVLVRGVGVPTSVVPPKTINKETGEVTFIFQIIKPITT